MLPPTRNTLTYEHDASFTASTAFERPLTSFLRQNTFYFFRARRRIGDVIQVVKDSISTHIRYI